MNNSSLRTPQAVAVIAARGGSKRIPLKNIRDIAGRPAITYPIAAALRSGLFDRIIVSTDHPAIASIAREAGAETFERPSALCADQVHVPEVVAHTLRALAHENYTPTFYCTLYATAVLLEASDLLAASHLLRDTPEADFVLSVSRPPLHAFKAMEQHEGFIQPAFPQWFYRPSQDYPDYVAPNGTFHYGRTAAFLNPSKASPARRIGYILPYLRAIDIDHAEDFALAEYLLRMKQEDTKSRHCLKDGRCC
jgi:pseudaminic acid cytidylyltransferase